MIQFKVSVPSKLNLFGEGRVGLMGSIDLRTTLTFKETSNSNIFLHIDHSDNHQTLNVPLELFLKFYNYCVQDIKSLKRKVLQCITDVNKSSDYTMIVRAFYHLLIYIAYKEQIEIKPFRMQLSAEFLVDNEFACSTSLTVCLVVCFLNWSRLQKGVKDIFDNANMIKILSYATRYEKIVSQYAIIDVFTCLFGSLTQYQDRRIMHVYYVRNVPSMTILLVDSKQKQCFDAQVQQVAELMDTMPEIVYFIFNSINTITKRAYDAIQRLVDIHQDKSLNAGSRTHHISAEHKVLENCIRINQNLLNSLNISHHLDDICSIARKHGMCGKYTDIGNGRFAYVWCPQHVDEPCTHMKHLANELIMQGFHVTQTKIGQQGTKIEQNRIE